MDTSPFGWVKEMGSWRLQGTKFVVTPETDDDPESPQVIPNRWWVRRYGPGRPSPLSKNVFVSSGAAITAVNVHLNPKLKGSK